MLAYCKNGIIDWNFELNLHWTKCCENVIDLCFWKSSNINLSNWTITLLIIGYVVKTVAFCRIGNGNYFIVWFNVTRWWTCCSIIGRLAAFRFGNYWWCCCCCRWWWWILIVLLLLMMMMLGKMMVIMQISWWSRLR